MFRLCLLVLLGVWHASAQLDVATTLAPGTSVDCGTVGINNCGACNAPGIDCAGCEIFAAMLDDFSGCELCDLNCLDCELDSTKTAVCKLCAPGYIVKSDGSSCVPCGLYCGLCSFADQTETTTVCTQCAVSAGFTLGSYSKQCQFCGTISGCLTCTEGVSRALTCSACMAGYYMDTTGSCSYCPSNCVTCISNHQSPEEGKCSLCDDGYILDSTDSTNCLSCQDECTKCTGIRSTPTLSTCSACDAGYYLDSNSNLCQPCEAGCATCTGGSSCATCITPGWYFDTTLKTCTACSYGCDTCKIVGGVETCSQCSDEWGSQGAFSSCQPCTEFCTSCSSSSECDDCDAGYAPVNTGLITVCLACPANCDSCSDGGGVAVCDTCADGYIAGFTAQDVPMCFVCPAHCFTCSYDDTTYRASCDECEKDGSGLDYYVVNGACKSCGAQCTDCTGGVCGDCQPYYFLNSGKCSKCPTHCSVCSDATTCTTCDDGYIPEGTGCSQCPANCATCSDGSTCVTCDDRYIVNAGATCDACSSHCSDCSDSSTCTTCETGYYVDANDACIACSTLDTRCSLCTDSTTCTQCPDGYYVDGALCTACGTGCTCDLSTNLCTGCIATAPTVIDTDTCYLCGAHCTACTYSSGVVCSDCDSGYYVNNNDACSACSDSNCITCPSGVCSECKAGYQQAPTKCTKVPNMCDDLASYDSTDKTWTCNSCTDDNWVVVGSGLCAQGPAHCDTAELDPTDLTEMTVICSVCDEGYGLNIKGTCDACPAFCTECHPDDTNKFMVCDTCDGDAAVNDEDCGECPEGCTTCANLNGEMYCSLCDSDGYATTPYLGDCIACDGCSQCSQVGGVSSCLGGTCADGTGLDSDGTCTSCDILSTVLLCSNCTDADESGNSECLDCAGSYILDPWATSCQPADALISNNCAVTEYRAYECDSDSCSSPFSWIDEGPEKGFCGLNCAVCGDIDSGVFLPAAQCQSASANYTQMMFSDACWVSMITDSNGKQLFARGGSHQYNCTFDHQFEFYSSTNTKQTFACCISGDNCNAQLQLDGTAGASAATFSLALLFASILVALRV